MPEPIKAKAPSFYGGSKTKAPLSGENVKSRWPLIAAVVIGGAGLILFLRSRGLSSSANTGPALSIYPDISADESGLANALQGLKALGSVSRSAGNGGDTTVTSTNYTNPQPHPDNTNTSPGTTPIVSDTSTTSGNAPISSQTSAAYDIIHQQLVDAGYIKHMGGYDYFDTGQIPSMPPDLLKAAGSVGILGTPGTYAGADYSGFTGLVGQVGGRTGNGYTYYVNGQPAATAPLGTQDPAAWAQQQANRAQELEAAKQAR